MFIAGRQSLNIMSLGGLALGVGMLVDNAIVVLESITRCREEGDDAVDGAAIRGTSRGCGRGDRLDADDHRGVRSDRLREGHRGTDLHRPGADRRLVAARVAGRRGAGSCPMLASRRDARRRRGRDGRRGVAAETRRTAGLVRRGSRRESAGRLGPHEPDRLRRAVASCGSSCSCVVLPCVFGLLARGSSTRSGAILSPAPISTGCSRSPLAHGRSRSTRSCCEGFGATVPAPRRRSSAAASSCGRRSSGFERLGVELLPEIHQGEFTAHTKLFVEESAPAGEHGRSHAVRPRSAVSAELDRA